MEEGSENRFFIATPEKAVCDTMVRDQNGIQDLGLYLYEDMRMDSKEVANLDAEKIREINLYYRHPRIGELINHIYDSGASR